MNVYEGKTQVLVYVGKKPTKKDTVASTGIIWAGYGDAQEVPHSAAVKMLQHPDVWVTEATFKAKHPAKSPHAAKKPASKSKGGTDFSALSQAPAHEGNENPDDGDGGDDSGDEGDDSGEPGDDAGAIEVAKAAILSLDSENPDHFGKQGPKIDAVRAAANDPNLDTKLVKAAWKELNANG